MSEFRRESQTYPSGRVLVRRDNFSTPRRQLMRTNEPIVKRFENEVGTAYVKEILEDAEYEIHGTFSNGKVMHDVYHTNKPTAIRRCNHRFKYVCNTIKKKGGVNG